MECAVAEFSNRIWSISLQLWAHMQEEAPEALADRTNKWEGLCSEKESAKARLESTKIQCEFLKKTAERKCMCDSCGRPLPHPARESSLPEQAGESGARHDYKAQ